MGLLNASTQRAATTNPHSQHTGQHEADSEHDNKPTALEAAQPSGAPATALLGHPKEASPASSPCDKGQQACSGQGSRHGAASDSHGARCMQPRDCHRQGEAHSHDGGDGGEGSDPDMTQEDLPIAQADLPIAQEAACLDVDNLAAASPHTLQELPAYQQHDHASPPLTEQHHQQPHQHQQQYQQHHQHVDDMHGSDEEEEARWEQALEAGLQSAETEADNPASSRQGDSADVIQLDTESADDLLDVLADAAAAMPAATCQTR